MEKNLFLKETLVERKRLISFKLKNNLEINIILHYENRYRNKGELVLSIEIPEYGGIFHSLSFSFEEFFSTYWVLRIGCIQGSNNIGNSKMKLLQKELNGMRPKALLIYILQQLAMKLDIKEILATSNSIQAHKKKHLIHLPWKHKIYNDYDTFFFEIKGNLQEDGWFKLPFTHNTKEMNEIPTHKRAYYKKRYEMLNEIAVKIFQLNLN